MQDQELTRPEAAQVVRDALKAALERGLAQAQAAVEEVQKAEKLAKGEKVKCGVCQSSVYATSAGLVGYHSKDGNKCAGGGSDPDRGQFTSGKPKTTHRDGPMRNHPDGEMPDPTQKSEPMSKAWRAGGPRPTSGPLAPKPADPKPAEKVAKSVPVGTGIARAMRLTVAENKAKSPVVAPKPVQNTPPPAKKNETMGYPSMAMAEPVKKAGPMPGMGTANPPAQKARVMSRFQLGQGGTPAGAKVPLPGLTPAVRPGGYKLPGTGPKASPPPIPAAAAVQGANKQLGGFKSAVGRTPKLAMKSEGMCKSHDGKHPYGKCS